MNIEVIWQCQKSGCNKKIKAEHEYAESLYAPKGMNWCRDKKGEHIFCDKHIEEWFEEDAKLNPNSVWIA